MTNLTMPNNFCFMKYALKSVPGLAAVGVHHGDGDGPRTPPPSTDSLPDVRPGNLPEFKIYHKPPTGRENLGKNGMDPLRL